MVKYKELSKNGFGYVDLIVDFDDFCSDNYIDYLEKIEENSPNVHIRLYYNINECYSFDRIDCKVIDNRPNFIPNKFWKEFKENVKLEWLESFNFDDDFLNSFNDESFKNKLEEMF